MRGAVTIKRNRFCPNLYQFETAYHKVNKRNGVTVYTQAEDATSRLLLS